MDPWDAQYIAPQRNETRPNATSTMSHSTRESERTQSAQQTLDILYDLSQLLNTGLDRQTLATCVEMIEKGTNPEALAAVVQEMRREKIRLRDGR